jgi:poly(A) polymerase
LRVRGSVAVVDEELRGLPEDGRLREIVALLAQRGTEGYFVGGCVRDVLLGRVVRDWDIAVAGNAPEVAQWVVGDFGAVYVPLDVGRGIVRVVFPSGEGQWHLDLSSYKGDIEADLSRRDFTINAMAVGLPLFTSTDCHAGSPSLPQFDAADVIDPFGGLKDLAERRIRAASDSIFEDDPVRLLRAVRLAAEYDFTVDEGTERLMRRQGDLLPRVPGERVREEITRLLSVPVSAPHLYYMDSVHLLTVVFPELDEAKGVEQPKEHFWEVFQHSLETVVGVERLLNPGDPLVTSTSWLGEVLPDFDEELGAVSRGVLVKLAALLHDVAKPRTKHFQEDGRMRFFGHPQEGSAIAAEIMRRLRFSSQQIRVVRCMIENHLRLWQMSHDALPTRRAIYRYFRDTGDLAVDIMLLSLGDFLATVGPRLDLEEWRTHTDLMGYILAEYERDESLMRPPKLVSGHDLMSLFGMQPGPGIGKALELVREAQGAGEIQTREEALALLRDHLGGYPSS